MKTCNASAVDWWLVVWLVCVIVALLHLHLAGEPIRPAWPLTLSVAVMLLRALRVGFS